MVNAPPVTRARNGCAYSFASFTGIFIDLWDEKSNSYASLFEPAAIAIKPAGVAREIEFGPAEIHERFDKLTPAKPVIPMKDVLRWEDFDAWVDQFTYDPETFES